MPKKFRVEIAPFVERDIESIWRFISADNPKKAKEFILSLEDHVETLELFPHRCQIIPEAIHSSRQYRHLLHESYRIIFRIDGHTVYALRIIHSAQLLDLNQFAKKSDG